MAKNLLTRLDFLKNDLPEKLQGLTEDTKPSFGIMSPQHMVEHLGMLFLLSIRPNDFGKELTDAEKAKFKNYLLEKDAPFPRGVKVEGINGLAPLKFENLEEAKAKLLQGVARFLAAYATNPLMQINHPKLGMLNYQEWIHFHEKHCKYHMDQFALLC